MSLNSVAEIQLVPQGYAALTFDARGHGQSEGLVSIDGPREIQDLRELFGWLAAQPHVNGQRIGAFGYSYGGGAIWRDGGRRPVRGDRAGDHLDRPQLRAPAAGSRPLGRPARLLAVDPGAAPGLESIVNDALAGQDLGAVHAFADQRSVRTLLGSIRVPPFLMQGRRDLAFDLDHALTACSRLKTPKRLYLADFGHPPAANPPGEAAHVLPQGAGMVRSLPEGPPERDREEAADRDRARSVDGPDVPPPGAAAAEHAAARVPGTRGDRIHRQGGANTAPAPCPHRDLRGSALRVSLASPNGWPRVVAVLSALTPQHKEIVVSAGGARVHLGAKPKRTSDSSRS